jgi:HEAT repeat protein
MSILSQLASSLGQTDEQPNIAVAEAIVANKNTSGVRELVDLLNGKDKAVKSDALKALYEIGYRAPELIAPFIAQFKNLLANQDNRLVWGAM